jgi:Ca2+/Na+ antiporter
MSNLKTYENISKEFIRYLDTLILLFLGSVMMSIALYKDPDTNFTQNSLFMAGAIALLGMSVISFLYVKDIINKALRIILFGVLFTLCVVYAYLDFKSINDKIQHDAMVERIEKEVKQRLKDIRDAQLEYMRVNGVYAQDYAQKIY